MKEVLDDIQRWESQGKRVAVARVVGVEGSGPRDPGATMVVSDAGEVAGSVSGGCVEGAVVEAALEILRGERERGVITFGYSDDDAFAVGLTCGGTVRLLIEPYEGFSAIAEALRAERPVAIATVIGGPDLGAKLLVDADATLDGSLGNPELDRIVARDAQGELASGTTAVRHYGPCGEARSDDVTVFIQQLGRDHRRFSVAPQHYQAVGTSLLATLKNFLGDDWTERLAADWAAAYGLIARVMVEAAEESSETSPACFSTARCCETAGCETPAPATSSPTDSSPSPANRSNTCRRVASASVRKSSAAWAVSMPIYKYVLM